MLLQILQCYWEHRILRFDESFSVAFKASAQIREVGGDGEDYLVHLHLVPLLECFFTFFNVITARHPHTSKKHAIEIKRESGDQTDDEILEQILLDHLGLGPASS